MARRRRRVFAQSPISKRTCGQDPDSESSPPCSPIGTRRLRQLALFDAGINSNNNSSVSASPLTPRTPRIAPRRLTESPRWRQSPSAARSGTPKIDPGVTVNPFTPANRNSTSKTRVSLRAAATYRYRVEFHEAGLLGQGQFGAVYKAVNRFDGCVYAVKKIKKPAKGGAYGDASAIREVCAHAVLGKHVNVVRYFSAWCEQNQMFIQSEYCNGGSVADVIQDHRINRLGGFSTEMANELLKQISSGLKYIHEQDLAHLDIKPANIFRSFSEVVTLEMPDIQHSGPVTYKIGDLGHVTKSTVKSVDEGDCRYMSKEMIDCDINKADLFKADIFALGMSIYEAVSLMELPQNGPVWHELRSGRVPSILSVDDSLNTMIQKMLNPAYELRPCAKDINEYFRSTQANEVNAQLQKLLKEEMLKNEKLLM